MMFHSHSFLTSQPLNTYQWPPSHPKWTQISPQLLASGSPDLWSQRGTGKRRLLGDQGSWRHWYMGYSDTHPPPPDSAGLWSLWHSRSVRDRVKVGFLSPLYLQCLNPSLPWRHSQWKDPGWSWHCPSLAQGELLHSLMSSSHREPVNPGGAGSGWGQVAKVIFFFL